MTEKRHALGAEELIELGKPLPQYRYSHTPYLARRRQMGKSEGNLLQAANLLGQAPTVDDLEAFLSEGARRAASLMGELMGDGGASDLLASVPASAPFLAQALLLEDAALEYEIRMTEGADALLRQDVGDISKALSAANTASANQILIDQAKDSIVSGAPESLQSDVRSALDATGVSGQALSPALGA